ncbi:MAG TPA: FtsQ-type POTRA domain-containing protein [Gaiellaceae bacterium]
MARPRVRVAVAPLPRDRKRAAARRFLPSAQSVIVGFGLLALAVGGYFAARETSAFAVGRVEVTGASPRVSGQVRRAVAPLRGTSLLALDGGALVRRLEALPTVVAAGYDRSFPHTLHIDVVPERPVAVVRQGAKAWLVSARGRVMAPVPPHALAHGAHALARIWIPRSTAVAIAGFLPANHAAAVARALALAVGFPAHFTTAALHRDGLTLRLRRGVELRLGEPTDIRLKLAIARRALRHLPPGSTYLDVSVPGRPVAGKNSQLSGRD